MKQKNYEFSDGYVCTAENLTDLDLSMLKYKHGKLIEKNKTVVLAISGHAQNGKDTCAKMFEEKLKSLNQKVKIIHYADLLKFLCKQYFDWNGEKDDAGRTLLQYVGTDIVRNKKPNFWVDFVFEILELFPDEWDFVIIPDTRFPNEVSGGSIGNKFNIVHIRVTRTSKDFISPLTLEQQQHPSETSLDNVTPDYLIENNVLFKTRKQVDRIVEELINKYKEKN